MRHLPVPYLTSWLEVKPVAVLLQVPLPALWMNMPQTFVCVHVSAVWGCCCCSEHSRHAWIEPCRCEQLAQGCYAAVLRSRVELTAKTSAQPCCTCMCVCVSAPCELQQRPSSWPVLWMRSCCPGRKSLVRMWPLAADRVARSVCLCVCYGCLCVRCFSNMWSYSSCDSERIVDWHRGWGRVVQVGSCSWAATFLVQRCQHSVWWTR